MNRSINSDEIKCKEINESTKIKQNELSQSSKFKFSTFFLRVLFGFFPFNPFLYDSVHEKKPDLYGPFIISSLLGLITLISFIIVYSFNYTFFSPEVYFFFFTFLFEYVFLLTFFIPLIYYLILKCFGIDDEYKNILCIYSYTLYSYILNPILAHLIYSYYDLTILVTNLVSTSIMIVSIYKYMTGSGFLSKMIMIVIIIIIQAGLFVLSFFIFMLHFNMIYIRR